VAGASDNRSTDGASPLAVYPVRTARGYWLAAAMLCALAGAGGGTLAFVALTGYRALFVPVIVGLAVLAPVIYWLVTPAYRIGGGRSAIRFFADRLELPAAGVARSISLPRSELHADAREMRVRDRVGGFAVATVRRGFLVRFSAGAIERALSTLTLVHPRAFLADLERYLAGESPLGPDARANPSVRTPDV
jgi:hypothetical protein